MAAEKKPGTIENGVLIGRDGYLFLAEGGHAVSDFVTGKRSVGPRNFEIFRRNISARVAWAAGHGARYLHLIMPDKQSIIPEAWTLEPPVRLGALYLDELPDLQPLLLYPADFLAAQAPEVTTRTDTHLSAYGSLLVATLLAEGFTGDSQAAMFSAVAAKLTVQTSSLRDLGHKLVPPVQEVYKTLNEELPGHWFGNAIPGGNNGGIDLRFNPRARYKKCVVFFGDSFGRDIAAMLQYWFSEVYFFRTGYFHPEIAAQCGPDIVITENVERYLNACLDDEDRPNFLLFPHLAEKTYEPSRSFAKALSAVLSFPRRPYAAHVTALGMQPRAPHADIAEVPAPAPVAAPPAPVADPVLAYDNLLLIDPPKDHGELQVLEAPRYIARHLPELVTDLSGYGLMLNSAPEQHIHGSYLVQRRDVLLFGPNHLVDRQGQWTCEARSSKQQFLDYFAASFYDIAYPGAKPAVRREDRSYRLDTKALANAVTYLDEPVFLATPLEADIWGRWVATVTHKVAQFRLLGAGRKFFCRVEHAWQRNFLQLLDLPDDAILPHDPGSTYICRDVMTVEYSLTNMSVSIVERANFYELVLKRRAHGTYPQKLFVSRLSRSRAEPRYRALQNEVELVAALEAKGFTMIEPEHLSFEVQVGMFSAAEHIVFLGGSALYNTVFCAPDCSVLTIESTDIYAGLHTEIFASLGLRHGVIFGEEDRTDPQPDHRRWSLDIARALPAIEAFFNAA